MINTKKTKRNLIGLAFYLFANLILTYPLIFNYFDSFHGVPHDNGATLWWQWAMHKAFWTEASFSSFDYNNYPNGIDLLRGLFMYTSDGINAFFGVLIPSAFAAYNTTCLIKSIFASFFMCLFLSRFISDYKICWLGGLIFVFNPFISSMLKVYGPNFIPMFFPLVLIAMLNLKNRFCLKTVLGFGVAAFLFFGENYYYTYFAFATLVLTLTVILILKIPTVVSREFLRNLFNQRLTWVVAVILTLLAIVAVRIHSWAISTGVSYQIENAMMRASQLAFYFIPAIDNSVFGKYFVDYYWANKKGLDTFELSQYLGYVPMLFFLITLYNFKKLAPEQKPVFRFFAISFICSILLALGPLISVFDIEIPGPAYPFYFLAPMFRHTSRYQFLVISSLLPCFLIGASFFFQRIAHQRWASWLKLAMIALLALEYVSFSPKYLVRTGDYMPKAYHYLADKVEDFAILEWPAHWVGIRTTYSEYQALHEKKLQSTTNISPWLKIWDPDDQRRAKELGYRYLVVNTSLKNITSFPLSPHTGDMGDKSFYKRERFGYFKLVKEFDDSYLFKLTDKFPPEASFAVFKQGFHLNSDHNTPFKWTSAKSSTLTIYSGAKIKSLLLEFEARSLEDKNIDFYLNGKKQAEIKLKAPATNHYTIRLNHVEKGANILKLVTKQPLTNIHKILGSPDQRNVGVFIGKFYFRAEERNL